MMPILNIQSLVNLHGLVTFFFFFKKKNNIYHFLMGISLFILTMMCIEKVIQK